jgi:cytochrome b561
MNLIARARAWASEYTSAGRYSPAGQILHWGLAALVFFQLWWGWRMARLPVGADKLDAYQFHAQLGLLTLLLILLRLMWRAFIPSPITDADNKGWQSVAAHVSHYLFYILLIALPISGWVLWSAMAPEQPLSVFGLPWGHLPLSDVADETRWAIMRGALTIHLWMVVVLLVLIVGHSGAALKHHFIDRDDAFAAMAPWIAPLRPKRREGRRHNARGRGAPPSSNAASPSP